MAPIILSNSNSAEGCKFKQMYKFTHYDKEVPLYEVTTMSAFNQLIGYAKYLNVEYGNVFYRGVNDITSYHNVLPSIMRKRNNSAVNDMNSLLKKVCEDTAFIQSLKLKGLDHKVNRNELYFRLNEAERRNRYRVEALVQHYVGYTRFLDVVDNHWVALWMGLHNFVMHGSRKKFCRCEKRTISSVRLLEALNTGNKDEIERLSKDLYEFVLLIAMPYGSNNPTMGISENDDFVTVDLRQALPSIYLRPHAQHALVVRKRDKSGNNSAKYYDMASQVVAILQIRIDFASQWLGNGTLVTAENLFPSPSIDNGYNNLLKRTDIFTYPFEILKYY